MSERRARNEKIRCDACPVMCYIAPGKVGACDRYANEGGKIIRCDGTMKCALIQKLFHCSTRSVCWYVV